MRRHWQLGAGALAITVAGCFPHYAQDNKDRSAGLWSSGQLPSNAPPAPIETASHVDSLSRQILAANPTIAFKPLFLAIGAPKETIFHQGKEAIVISDSSQPFEAS